ncbi:telomerase reverse transcriptase [Heteronotia binoei]|uniref:telomerase reverse transcriptase n=1 Tax=Heteronotia binoei TaxID=13085 RepID=UPI00293170BD|nr:telomerase reverse transcriptase [Heteronotia binoei]
MRDLLYSHQPWKERLPQSFVLNRLKGYQAGGRRLVETIFLSDKVPKQPSGPNPPSCCQRKKRLPKRYRCLKDKFQELLRNHVRCPYPAMLKKNCPVLVSDQICERKQGEIFSRTQWGSVEGCLRGVAGGLCPFPEISGRIGEHDKLSQEESEKSVPRDSFRTDFLALLKQNSSPWQVYTFVRECLERVVPAALWGSSHNKHRFYKNVKKFISLGKQDTFPLRELLWKMRVNDCAWLRLTKEHGRSVPASEHRFRTHLLSKFLFWLMNSYVVQLLWSFFYITETEYQKNLLLFFRKAVWGKLQSLAVRSHLAKVHLLALSKEDIETLQQRRCVPLAAKLRFIPKVNGLRPVVRLNNLVGAEKFCRKSRDKKVQYFNMQLKNLYSVLKYEQKKNPSLLGSSVFGKDDICAAWKKFVLKVLGSDAQRLPAFYFVKADVSGAYDTIPHHKVVEVVAQILGPSNNSSYCIRRYAVVIRAKNGQIIKKYRRHVSTSKDFMPDMTLFVRHLQQSTSLRNAVVVEQSVCLKESCSDLFEFFLQLIHSNILKIENRYYVQCCGIPQGSILSTLLCSLCYGDMENKLLPGVQEDGVLMRLTDDFLLVTPHLEAAKTFLRTLARGIPEYGFSINPAKTMMNFPLDEAVDIPGCSAFKQFPAHTMFPWCGLLIDTQTLEVYCDYSRYACTSVRASLSFSSSSSTAGVHMRSKLFVVLQLQCHRLFLDLQINSLRTVCINIYKIFLLQAYRFHSCVLQLPFNQQIKNNSTFFLRIIADTASCGFSILKAKNTGIFPPATSPSALLSFEAVQWLCYHAFSVKLANHRVIYKCLLMPLKYCKMWLLQKIPEATLQLLQKATELWLCEDFRAILD